jgi:undecaprenyl-diphosphatase
MSRAELQPAGGLSPGQAVALGLLHGPAELLPISSSGHVTLIPWLLGWNYDELDPELRKSFEVALHAGTAAALLITLRNEVSDTLRSGSPRLALLIGLSFVPPAIAGYLLEGPIERHLGRPASVAAGLVAGSLAMWAADRTPGRRDRHDATAADALWLGAAQASALMPGVSRNGATVAVARRRGFTPEEANALSRHVALPIIAAATARRLLHARLHVPRTQRPAVAAGTVASFISTLGFTWIIGRVERRPSLLPYVIYRLGLAGLVGGRWTASRRNPRNHRSER